MREKDLLLDSLHEVQQEDINIPVKNLYITLSLIAIILLILGPKIYLTNHIYYESLGYNSRQNQYDTLKEENIFLQQQLEKINFENDSKDITF